MTRVVARIQHHPSRQDLIPDLLASLAPLPVVVSPHASDPPNPWDGYQLALQSGLDDPTKPTHLLVLQDDVEVCRNFPRAVTLVAERFPEHPVVLFLARLPEPVANDALQAAKRRECYIRFRPSKFCPVVAILWPVQVAARFLEWAQSGVKLPGYPNRVASDDAVVGEWQKRKQEEMWVTVPSLVEHPDREKSIIGRRAMWGRDRSRCALMYVGDDDALSHPW